MKKLLIAAGVIALTATTQVFAHENAVQKGPCPCPMRQEVAGPEFGHPMKMHKPHFDVNKFEQDLNLTETQKEQAKQIREKDAEATKPLFEQIKTKRQEMEQIFNERLTVKERQEKLEPIQNQIRELKKQIHDIKNEGRKEFESILTDKQLKKLEKLKVEAKQNFKKHMPRKDMHRPHPMPIECKCNQKTPVPPVVE